MKIVTLLAASLMATSTLTTIPAFAQDSANYSGQQGAPLMKGLSGPEELANLIDTSLAKDPSGNTLLDEKRCKLNGSCATPSIYLAGITTWHPNVSITLKGLSKYIRGLKNAVADGEYYSARMVGRNLDLTSGFKRKLMPGEYAWYDTQTGDPILFENCGNIIKLVELKEVEVTANPCQVINPYTDAGSKLHIAVMLPADEEFHDTHKCLAHKLAGESDWKPGLPVPCQKVVCDFSSAERRTGLEVKLLGNADQLQDGDQMIRVPLGVTVALCYVDENGVKHMTQIIVKASYQHGNAWVMRTAADNPSITYTVFWHPAS